MLSKGALVATCATLVNVALALNPIIVDGADFVDSVSGDRFQIIGVDYQPGGEAAYNPALQLDPLSDPERCLRDAALMQRLGLNTVRVYNLDPALNHDGCASIFNYAGIYMLLDVNSPFESIHQDDPGPSYTSDYLRRVFAVVDQFRGYDNTLGFFSANELVNDMTTAKIDPPYIRAVTRDIKQFIKARGGRQIPVGYSATDVREVLEDNWNYVQCSVTGGEDDESRSDFFGLNSYSWCGGDATFHSSRYDELARWFADTTIPVFFSEYGCNEVQPRVFDEVLALYGPQMTMFSGGLVYEFTQEDNDFGLVDIDNAGNANLMIDFYNLQKQYNKIDLAALLKHNSTATSLTPPTCNAGLIDGSTGFSTNFRIPQQPAGAAAMMRVGVGVEVGSFGPVTATAVQQTIADIDGNQINGVSITRATTANVPGASPFSATSTGLAAQITGGAGGMAMAGPLGAALLYALA